MKNFFLLTTLLALALGGLGHAIEIHYPAHFSRSIYAGLIIVYLVTLIIHWFLIKAVSSKTHRQFNTIFMLVSSGKLMFYLFGILVYGIFAKDDIKPFLISFLVFYILFTIVEITAIMAHIKRLRSLKK